LRACDLSERGPNLSIDLVEIERRQVRKARADALGNGQHAGADRPQHASPLLLDLGGVEQLAAQPGGLELDKRGLAFGQAGAARRGGGQSVMAL